uniref:Uncharacterized protein n=1 Tax=Arundo donax TaxID=35708 RepID=A0A0A9H4X2_ARUDO
MFPQFILNLNDKQASTTSGQEIDQTSHLQNDSSHCNKSCGRNRSPSHRERSK